MIARGALLLLGFYVCVVGAVVHRQVWRAGDTSWPWGLVLVVVVTGLVTLAANHGARVGGAWFAVGWAGALLSLQWSPGGGYLVASDTLGTAFTVGCLGVIVLGVAIRPRLEQ